MVDAADNGCNQSTGVPTYRQPWPTTVNTERRVGLGAWCGDETTSKEMHIDYPLLDDVDVNGIPASAD